MDELIAVTAATGGMGTRVARRLAERGARQRLVVRDASRAPELPGAEVRAASGYGDEDGMRRALEGVSRLFLIPAAESPDRAEQQVTAVRAAARAGVRHVIYLSFVNAASATAFPLAADHARTEEAVLATGLPFTFLRMNLYMDFLPLMVGADGVIRGPAGDGRIAAVARDDLTDVAAAVLADGGHEGAAYDVTGPQDLTLAQAAAVLAEASGRPVRFHDETVEEAYASRAGVGEPWEIEAWVGSYLAMADGTFAGTSDTVSRLAGHEPISLAEFARRHPESLAHVG